MTEITREREVYGKERRKGVEGRQSEKSERECGGERDGGVCWSC